MEMLRQTFDGRAWHGPSLIDALRGVDKAQAIERPIEVRHTIWEIVNHCSFWMEAVNRALHGETLPDIVSNEDWPKMKKTDEDWTNTLEKLKNTYEELVNSIKELNHDQLIRKIHGSYNGHPYAITFRRMLHGISNHNTYHAGQIAVLREEAV
jgi:uncharacterized damage-inducible protein DinB